MSGTDASRFTRMDLSTKAQWDSIIIETLEAQPRVAEAVLGLLESLGGIRDGFAVDQLTHSLQTAARAEEAGADEELIVASLCHDVGKAISVPNHPKIAAEILRPYVRPEVCAMIGAHQDFQGRHYYEHLGLDPDARAAHQGEVWFEMAERFADEWDQLSFDPKGPIPPLEHFEPMVQRIFSTPNQI